MNGKWLFYLQRVAIYLHYSGDGSTPVGLWAQEWSKTIDPLAALVRSSIIPSKSNPLSLALKYLYFLTLSPVASIMAGWFPQVGSETRTSPGANFFKKSNPILKAPVPERH